MSLSVLTRECENSDGTVVVVVAVVGSGMFMRRRIEGGRMVTRVRVEPLAIEDGSMYKRSPFVPISSSSSLCDGAMLLSSKVTREERVIVLGGAVTTRGREGRAVTDVPVTPERDVRCEDALDTTDPLSSS